MKRTYFIEILSTFIHCSICLQFSENSQFNITFINISSLGITCLIQNCLYSTSFHHLFEVLFLNQYEFSKLCFDTTLELAISHTGFKCFSILDTNLLRDNKLPMAFKLFSILSPFRVDKTRILPLSTTEDISYTLIDVINNISQYKSNYNIIRGYSYYPALSLLPSFSSSFLMLIIASFLPSLLPCLVNLPLIGRFVRLAIFLYIL